MINMRINTPIIYIRYVLVEMSTVFFYGNQSNHKKTQTETILKECAERSVLCALKIKLLIK